MEIKEISLVDAIQQREKAILFDIEFGYFYIDCVRYITAYDKEGSEHDLFDATVNHSYGYESQSVINKRNNDRAIDAINKCLAEKYNYSSFIVSLECRIVSYWRLDGKDTYEKIEFDLDALDYEFDSVNFDNITPLPINELKIGSRYLLVRKVTQYDKYKRPNGTISESVFFTLKEIYEKIQNNNAFGMGVSEKDDSSVVLHIGDVILPLLNKNKEGDKLAVINNNLFEYKLDARVSAMLSNNDHPTIINVYWNKIDTAARYIVSLYSINEDFYSVRYPIHLKDYEVSRNESLLVINDLLLKNFIIKVKAENADGEIISETRGIINSGKPQDFVKWQKR